jgi:hypothetical protein
LGGQRGPAAFQPSHILQFVVPANQQVEFFEDIDAGEVGTVIRGNWFGLAGDDLSLRVVVESPSGEKLYEEGPVSASSYDDDYYYGAHPTREGAFSFKTGEKGTYKVTLSNPLASSDRMVVFGWLKGRDDDDPIGVALNDPDALTPTTASEYAYVLMSKVSAIHKKLDDISSVQQYTDVRFHRNLQTVESTKLRLKVFTLGETAAIIISVVLTILFFRTLKLAPLHGGNFLPTSLV